MSLEKLMTYRCPNTDAVVDHRIDASSTSRQTYQPVVCAACGQLHFVHRDTGLMLGGDRDTAKHADGGEAER